MNDTMTVQLFIFFAISTLLVSATPGSNMLFAFQCGLNHGLRRTLWAMAGLMLGLMILPFGSLCMPSAVKSLPTGWDKATAYYGSIAYAVQYLSPLLWH